LYSDFAQILFMRWLLDSELKVMLKQFLSFQIVMSNEIFDGFSVKPIAL